MQSHLTAISISESRRPQRPVDLQPGFGAPDLHLGQSEGQLIDLWNEPDRKEQHEDSLHFLYRKLNFEVELHNRRVERLFFFRPRGSDVKLRIGHKEVAYGMTRQQVVRRFGKPTQQGKGFAILRKYVRGWIYYPSGVQFEFGKSGKLELVTIFPRDTA